jgi:hypothetical protein
MTEAKRLSKEIWKLVEGDTNEFKIKYLILDLETEKYKEGLNKGIEICKETYQSKPPVQKKSN